MVLLTSIAVLVPTVGIASAATFDDLFQEFVRTQTIDSCKYSPKDLRDVRGAVGSDTVQYEPEFVDALDTAIATRVDCGKDAGGAPSSSSGAGGGTSAGQPGPSSPVPTTTRSTTTITTTTTAIATPTPTTPGPAAVAQPSAAGMDGVITARARTPLDTGPEGWAWAILAAVILAAAAAGWALVNSTGRVRRLAPLGHAMGEAGWRIGLRWAEFRDWVRFGTGR